MALFSVVLDHPGFLSCFDYFFQVPPWYLFPVIFFHVFLSSTDPTTSVHLLHHFFSFSPHLSKGTVFPSTTAPFCWRLIESLSSSNGSVRISRVQENRWIDREGKKDRDKETEREAGRKRDAPGLLTPPSVVWMASEQQLLWHCQLPAIWSDRHNAT